MTKGSRTSSLREPFVLYIDHLRKPQVQVSEKSALATTSRELLFPSLKERNL
jgi:hypothetical protein